MNPLYVGIDVSLKSNVAYLMKPDGSKLSNFLVPNSHTGSVELTKRIISAVEANRLTDVIIGKHASIYSRNRTRILRRHHR